MLSASGNPVWHSCHFFLLISAFNCFFFSFQYSCQECNVIGLLSLLTWRWCIFCYPDSSDFDRMDRWIRKYLYGSYHFRESQDCRGWKEPTPCQCRPPTVGCTGRHPGQSWISPEKKNTQPSWAACSSLCHPHCEEVLMHICAELSILQFVAISACSIATHWWKESGHVPLPPTP